MKKTIVTARFSRLFTALSTVLFAVLFTILSTNAHAQGKADFYADIFSKLTKGQAVTQDSSNAYYLYGVVSKYRAECTWPYANTVADLERYISKAKSRATRDIYRNTFLTMFANPVRQGGEVQKGADDTNAYITKHGCKASRFTKGLERLVLQDKKNIGESVFVSSCMQQKMSRAQCECVGEIGEELVEGALDQPYSQELIRSFLDRRPSLAYTLPKACNL